MKFGLIIALLLLSVGRSEASEQFFAIAPLAIDGYSVVSYFEQDRAELGSQKFSVEYGNKLYWFVSAAQVKVFKANPAQYIPAFKAFCPYSLTLGKILPIDPTKFKIVGGRLLLFHADDDLNGLVEWNKAGDESVLLEKARSELFRLDI